MDIRNITPTYSVAPQLHPSELADVAAAGYACVICNRPDAEVPPELQADAIEVAAKAAGLKFLLLPLTHQTMNPGNVARQKEFAASAPGPVLAYCASGTRSTVVWALGQVGDMPVDDILSAAHAGGYDLQNLRPALEAYPAAKLP